MGLAADCIAPVGGTFEVIDPSLVVSGMAINAVTLTQGQLKLPALEATWSNPTDPDVVGVQFEYQEDGLAAGAQRSAPQGAGTMSWSATNGLLAAKTYLVMYRAVGANNTFGLWSTPVSKVMPSLTVASEVEDQGDLATLDQVDTPEIVNNAVTDTASVQATSTITQADSTSVGNKILELTRTTAGGNLYLIFSASWLIRNQQELFFYVFVDNDYNWNGSAETNHLYQLPVETSTAADIQNITTFSFLVTGLAAGSHVVRIYIRNITGSTVDIRTRTLSAAEYKK